MGDQQILLNAQQQQISQQQQQVAAARTAAQAMQVRESPSVSELLQRGQMGMVRAQEQERQAAIAKEAQLKAVAEAEKQVKANELIYQQNLTSYQNYLNQQRAQEEAQSEFQTGYEIGRAGLGPSMISYSKGGPTPYQKGILAGQGEMNFFRQKATNFQANVAAPPITPTGNVDLFLGQGSLAIPVAKNVGPIGQVAFDYQPTTPTITPSQPQKQLIFGGISKNISDIVGNVRSFVDTKAESLFFKPLEKIAERTLGAQVPIGTKPTVSKVLFGNIVYPSNAETIPETILSTKKRAPFSVFDFGLQSALLSSPATQTSATGIINVEAKPVYQVGTFNVQPTGTKDISIASKTEGGITSEIVRPGETIQAIGKGKVVYSTGLRSPFTQEYTTGFTGDIVPVDKVVQVGAGSPQYLVTKEGDLFVIQSKGQLELLGNKGISSIRDVSSKGFAVQTPEETILATKTPEGLVSRGITKEIQPGIFGFIGEAQAGSTKVPQLFLIKQVSPELEGSLPLFKSGISSGKGVLPEVAFTTPPENILTSTEKVIASGTPADLITATKASTLASTAGQFFTNVGEVSVFQPTTISAQLGQKLLFIPPTLQAQPVFQVSQTKQPQLNKVISFQTTKETQPTVQKFMLGQVPTLKVIQAPQLGQIQPVQQIQTPISQTQQQQPQISQQAVEFAPPTSNFMKDLLTVIGPESPKFKKTKFGFRQRRKAFAVQIRRRGKFFTIGEGLPIGRAEELGARRTRETLAATFRLMPKGETEVSDIAYTPSPAIFRAPKRGVGTSLAFVERRGRRLDLPSARLEIKQARRAKSSIRARRMFRI